MNKKCSSFALYHLCILAALPLFIGCGAWEKQDPSILFQDSFQTEPGAPWAWVRENPQAHKIEKGLHIKIEPGGLMGAATNAKNILVRPLPPEAKSVSVSVDTNHKKQYEQAGLNLYRDDNNYIKLVREFVDGKNWIVLVVEVNAKPSVVNKVPLPEGKTCIGLEFGEKGVTAKCWGDSGEITTVGEAQFPMEPRPRVGVFTQSGEDGADRWACFTDFRISSKALESRKKS